MRLPFKVETVAITFLQFAETYPFLISPPQLFFQTKLRRHSAGGLRVRAPRVRNQSPSLQRPRPSSSLRRSASTPRPLDRRTPQLIMEALFPMLRKSPHLMEPKKFRPHRHRTLSHEPRERRSAITS